MRPGNYYQHNWHNCDKVLLKASANTTKQPQVATDKQIHMGTKFRIVFYAFDAPTATKAADAAFAEHADAALAAPAAALAESHAPELGALWHERAGRELSSAGRYQAAVYHLERALELVPAGDDRRNDELGLVRPRAFPADPDSVAPKPPNHSVTAPAVPRR